MSLIVETGTGNVDSESYCSVETADAYHSSIGNETEWCYLDTYVKEQLLRKATLQMLQVYWCKWAGRRANELQALDWPRECVYANGFAVSTTLVPVPVQKACAEYALRAKSGALAADIGQAVKREKIGVLEVEYADASTAEIKYPALDRMVEPYFKTRAGRIMLERA
ncbi:MAG: DnaT-like ssDNA-binding protein [Janthinobacterium lividum]